MTFINKIGRKLDNGIDKIGSKLKHAAKFTKHKIINPVLKKGLPLVKSGLEMLERTDIPGLSQVADIGKYGVKKFEKLTIKGKHMLKNEPHKLKKDLKRRFRNNTHDYLG